MLEMNNKAIRFLAHMGARGSLGQAMYDYASSGKDFFALSADLLHASGFDRIIAEYPEKVVDVGIAEQNLIGVSAGLARTGIPTVATTWAMFASARVADQVRNFLGFMQMNVKLIGLDSGLTQSRFTYSHTNPPDIAIMRAIPGITIISPCDGLEIYKAFQAAMELKGPVYFRLTGGALIEPVYKDAQFDYEIGKAITVCQGKDVAIIGCGSVLSNVMRAAKLLKEDGIEASVIDMHTVKPLDTDMLDSLKAHKLIVTVEEHLLNGGLGSAAAEYYMTRGIGMKFVMLGIDDNYPLPGSVRFNQNENGLSAEKIAERIRNELK